MEPDVIRIYSSSPPPMEDAAEEEDSDFGDFGTFSAVPSSISFTEFDTPTTFNQSQALAATSPPELIGNNNSKGPAAHSHSSSNGTHGPHSDLSKANGVVPTGHGPSERTETKKVLSSSVDFSVRDSTGSEPANCNGGGSEVLTNGFATFEVQGSPSSQHSVHSDLKGTSGEDTGAEEDFADFAAFSNAEGNFGQTEQEDSETPAEHGWVEEQGMTSEDDVRDTNGTVADTSGLDSESVVPSEAPGGSCNTDRGSDTDSLPRDAAFTLEQHLASQAVCTNRPLALNGLGEADRDDSKDATAVLCDENDLPPPAEDSGDGEAGRSDDGKGSGNETPETETETETSLGRPLSTDALEEFGDMSTTGSVPSPPLQGDTATPADHSQLPEDDDEEDFGDFGDAGAFGGQGFADFDRLDAEPQEDISGPAERRSPSHNSPVPAEEAGALGGRGFADFERPDVEQQDKTSSSVERQERSPSEEQQERSSPSHSPVPAQEATNTADDNDDDDDFGDFNSPKFHSGGGEADGVGNFAAFPVSDSFGNFSSAALEGADEGGEDNDADAGWSAFGEQQPAGEEGGDGGESWAAFSTEQSTAPPAHGREEEETQQQEEEEDEWHESEAPAVSEEASRTDRQSAQQRSSRVGKLFEMSFPRASVPSTEDQVTSLKILLEPAEDTTHTDQDSRCVRGSVWLQLKDIHDALGLRYQWGGSYCNKALLCCLGIDTRNILFTGQKKQPVIVPMYAASLGMLEPTKEPVKPVSAAEMIASIAQTPPAAPQKSPCPTDTVQQEALPPVQFDWSSSGLTNPLDASGGSSLLNLDFFGPVEDSGSTSSPSIPGVDPELYELTTSKLEGGSGSRVADAFARLMSTMDKTSTSTRKPRKEENLSSEASTVISSLPDLSFMTAKVLMFPATLTPLRSAANSD